MQAGLITGRERIELVDVPDTDPLPGCLTVDITLCGICGTEVGSYRTGVLHSPAVCGHEWIGTVSAVGAGVHGSLEGERVVVSISPPCGDCPECRAGHSDNCRVANMMVRGKDPLAPNHGGFAPRINVDAQRVLTADSRLTDVQGAMVEPAGVAFHGVNKSGIRPGDLVTVFGGGPIGLFAMQFARLAGAGRVILVEPSERRRDLATRLGVDLALAPEDASTVVGELTNGVGADVVIEASGVATLLQTCIELARTGGTTTLLSYLAHPSQINGAKLMAREARIVGANAFPRWEHPRVMDYIASGRVRVEPLHSATIALANLPERLPQMARGDGTDIKVLVDPRA